MVDSPFKILGVSENASDEEVRRAYRKTAAKYHPDTGGDAWVFQQVQEAFEQIMQRRGFAPEINEPPKKGGTNSSETKQTETVNDSEPAEVNTKATSGVFQLLTGELPLQNETTYFILIGALDIFMTYILLCNGGIEANPVANFFYVRWGFNGMVAFKMLTIALVTVLAQVIAQFELKTAKRLLIFGSVVIGLVVLYSMGLIFKVLA